MPTNDLTLRADPTRFRTCLHESGHLLMANILNRPFTKAVIHKNGGGSVSFSAAYFTGEDRIMISLAGRLAELLHCEPPYSPPDRRDDSDDAAIDKLLAEDGLDRS